MRHKKSIGLAFAALAAGCSTTPSTPSSSHHLSVPSLPAGWKTVTHDMVSVDVPSSWTVEPWHPTCGVTTPTVYLGPEGLVTNCTAPAPGAQVVLGSFAYQGSAPVKNKYVNGLEAVVVSLQEPVAGSPGEQVTDIWVRVVGKLTVYISVGNSSALPGGGPGLAEEIAATVHSKT